jgi:2-polyprenyl-6-hydroxyphenyl methylase/3-demethylubiquinone-9 3-methyltransferase
VSPLVGTIDFNKSCVEFQGTFLPSRGIAIDYNRCPVCGFLFTAAFDGWSKHDFLETIYNDDYILVDPDYRDVRPKVNLAFLSDLFADHRSELAILDYGGGNGALASLLREAGFAADTYDPLVAEFSTLPVRRYPLICSFETLEHTPDPRATIREMSALLADPGMIIFSTLLQPPNFESKRLGWWYVGPRNGHVSLFSRKALELAWRKEGLRYGSFDHVMHVAFRQVPAFARHLFPGQ